MKTSKLAQCFDVEIDPVTLDKIVDGLLAVSALSGAEIRLLLQKNEAFATLACLRNAAKVKSNAGKLLPCEDEAFAKKAILTGCECVFVTTAVTGVIDKMKELGVREGLICEDEKRIIIYTYESNNKVFI